MNTIDIQCGAPVVYRYEMRTRYNFRTRIGFLLLKIGFRLIKNKIKMAKVNEVDK